MQETREKAKHGRKSKPRYRRTKTKGKSLVLLQTGTTSTQAHMTAGWKVTESDEPTKKPERKETEDKAQKECVAATVGHMSG